MLNYRLVEYLNRCYFFVQFAISRLGFVLGPRTWNLGREHNFEIYDRFDYVRIATLELISQELRDRQLEGSVAELGVFRGEFASKINEAFPSSKLYLFDTFQSFDQKDEIKDKESGFFSDHVQDFSKTSVDIVMRKMKFPDRCIIKKGHFPDTANDVSDEFVFVSIDVDLYDPIYNGLSFFYPRLKKGGYIFVHDYNNAGYKGTKAAVKEFALKNNIALFPLCDGGGTCVITK
jgi:O-methyltransferase